MGRFVGSEMEMDTLQSEYRRDGSSLVVLYGRCRLGKTTLINEFVKGKEAPFSLQAKNLKFRSAMYLRKKLLNLQIATFSKTPE